MSAKTSSADAIAPRLPAAGGQVGEDPPAGPPLAARLDLAPVELDAALGAGVRPVRLGIGDGRQDDVGQTGERIGESPQIDDVVQVPDGVGLEGRSRRRGPTTTSALSGERLVAEEVVDPAAGPDVEVGLPKRPGARPRPASSDRRR